MVSEARGRIFRRKDGKYLIYIPVNLAEDSMFPFKEFGKGKKGAPGSFDVKVSFKPGGEAKLIIEEWPNQEKR